MARPGLIVLSSMRRGTSPERRRYSGSGPGACRAAGGPPRRGPETSPPRAHELHCATHGKCHGRQDPIRQAVGFPRGAHRAGRLGAAVHRPPPDPRGDLAAGLRGPGAVRPQAVAGGGQSGGGRSQRADHRPQRGHRRPGVARAGGDAGPQLRHLRHHRISHERPAPGRGAHHRPGAGRHPAGHDRGVRRLAHRHARRLRGAGLRHRHLRGRAHAGHADPAAAQVQEHAGAGRWPAGSARVRQGHDPGHHRRHRHRRRHRLCHRVRRRGGARAVHGRAHDAVQHGHRGRRAGRPGGGGRHHHRLRPRPAVCAAGRGLRTGRRCLAGTGVRRRMRASTGWSNSTPPAWCRR